MPNYIKVSGGYLATIPNYPHASGFGETKSEAATKLRKTIKIFVAWKKSQAPLE